MMLKSKFCFLYLSFVLLKACYSYLDPIFNPMATSTLKTCESSVTTEVATAWKCRQMCIEDGNCIAFRTEPFSTRWKCYLFEYGPTYNLTSTTRPDGFLGIKLRPASQLYMGADGYFYWMIIAPNFSNAKSMCSGPYGSRLAILKTNVTFHSVTQLGLQNVVVDLVQDINLTTSTFGDGTPFLGSDVNINGVTQVYPQNQPAERYVFRLHNGYFLYYSPAYYMNALCQGNPLGSQW